MGWYQTPSKADRKAAKKRIEREASTPELAKARWENLERSWALIDAAICPYCDLAIDGHRYVLLPDDVTAHAFCYEDADGDSPPSKSTT